jgi:poly-gamma-glutamate synthesis protein (capsule biosynthesis protein)
MKKRKLKRSVLYISFFIIIIGIVIIVNNKSDISNNVDNTINTDVDKVIEESKEKRMSIIAVGDVLIHESVYKDALNSDGTYNFHKMFIDVEDIIKKYDLKYCNQESTIGGSALGISGYPSFNSPDEIGDEIVNLGFNLISLANNHALDRGVDAIKYSNSYWKAKDVVTAGTYDSMEERDEIRVYEKNGIKYAFLAYTTISNTKVPNGYILNMYSADRAQKDIESVKDKVDVIIVSMHWGVEDTNTPTDSQRQIAEYLSSLGVNLIIGAHPHVVQPVEYIGDTLVIYSLGNFISNQLSIRLNNGIGLMVGMDIVVNEDKVTFDNLYKELILSYASHSTNFKVIPFSKLNNELLPNYKDIEKEYMSIVNGD